MEASERSEIVVDSIVDRVYVALRDRILSGELARGTRLRQESLAATLGVSRTPLREALRRLHSEGLVELETNRGARVADARGDDMERAYEARLVLEPGAARLAAERADPAAIEALQQAVDAQRRAPRTVGALFAASRAFHLALVAAAGNPHLDRLAEGLWVPRIGAAILERQEAAGWEVEADVEAHRAIAAAVAAGDGPAAERLTQAHIAGAFEAFAAANRD